MSLAGDSFEPFAKKPINPEATAFPRSKALFNISVVDNVAGAGFGGAATGRGGAAAGRGIKEAADSIGGYIS